MAQGHFLTPRQSVPLGTFTDLSVGDVDGDGDLDLVGVNDAGRLAGPNQLLLNNGHGGFDLASVAQFPSPQFPNTIQGDLVDVDGDGDLDWVASGDLLYSAHLFRNVGGNFADVSATAFPGLALQDFRDQVVADFDGDGDADLLLLNGIILLLQNDGTGTFHDATATSLPGVPFVNFDARGSIATDIDGDGDLDVVVSSYSIFDFRERVPVAILVNQGNGVLTLGWTLTAATPFLWATQPCACVFADLDGDSLPDVVVRDPLGTRLQFRVGAAYVDRTATHLPAGTGTAWPSLAVDVDADGDLDLVGDGVMLFNDGTGTFVTANRFAPADWPVLACDSDGDGDQDVLTASTSFAVNVRANFFRQIESLNDPVRGATYSVEFWAPAGQLGPSVVVAGWSLGQTVLPLGDLGVLRLDPTQTTLLPWLSSAVNPNVLTFLVPNDVRLAGLAVGFQAAIFDLALPPHLSNLLLDVIQ